MKQAQSLTYRRQIAAILQDGPRLAKDIADIMGLSARTVGGYLKIMRLEGIVTSQDSLAHVTTWVLTGERVAPRKCGDIKGITEEDKRWHAKYKAQYQERLKSRKHLPQARV